MQRTLMGFTSPKLHGVFLFINSYLFEEYLRCSLERNVTATAFGPT